MTHPVPAPFQRATSQAGRWWLVGMGLFLAAAGLLFTAGLWHAYSKVREVRGWERTPCRIISSVVRSERPSPGSNVSHRAEVRYLYTFEGTTHTGSRLRRVDGATAHETRARQAIAAYPVGTETECWVNPARPEEAVLQAGSLAPLYSLWFPLLFVVGGLGITWNAWSRGHKRLPEQE